MTLSARVWLCLPPSVLYTLDVGITLAGQEPAWWCGGTRAIHEANPLAYRLLAMHPAVFVVLAVVWWLTFCTVLWKLPHGLAVVLAFALTGGHAIGAASWLIQGGLPGLLCTVAVFAAAERLVAWSWKHTTVQDADGR